eukprot:76203-Prymnesium_polylepis.1
MHQASTHQGSSIMHTRASRVTQVPSRLFPCRAGGCFLVLRQSAFAQMHTTRIPTLFVPETPSLFGFGG